MKELFTGIYSKFSGSTDLKNTLTGGMHNTFAPQGTTCPYGVFQLVSGRPDWMFAGEDMEDVIIQFSLFDDQPSATRVSNAYNYLRALYDNCTLTITGYSTLYMWREMQQLLRDEEEQTWQYIVQYRIVIEET